MSEQFFEFTDIQATMTKEWAIIRRLAVRPFFLFAILTTLFAIFILGVVRCALIANTGVVRISFWEGIWVIILALLVAGLTSTLTLACFILYRRNGDYKEIAGHLHSINHTYRDVVSNLFGGEELFLEEDKVAAILETERQTLSVICRKIANIFWALTGKICSATVFLRIEKGSDEIPEEGVAGERTAVFLWAVGTHQNEREDALFQEEDIVHGSIFHKLDTLQENSENAVPHILDNDFKGNAPSAYPETKVFGLDRRARPGSILLVPIRWRNPESAEPICIGYLSIECASKNRFFTIGGTSKNFNDSEHLQFLSAFADQMFNFISLLRQRVADLDDYEPQELTNDEHDLSESKIED